MKVGFIGCGNMGGALAKAAAACADAQIYLFDRDDVKAAALASDLKATVAQAREIAEKCDIIFLAVKPNVIPTAAGELKPFIKGATVVSMAAGVRIADIEAILPDTPIIRIMPNTPAAIGEGMILWCASSAIAEENEAEFLAVMQGAGKLLRLDEEKIDAGTAVSGCGPAFVYMFIDALIKGGIDAGLTPEEARLLATETVRGAAGMVAASDRTPEELRIAVCSPGGSTIEGVNKLREGGFEQSVYAAVGASFKRTQELGK